MLLSLWIIVNFVPAMCYIATAFVDYFGFGIEFSTQMLIDAFYIFVVKRMLRFSKINDTIFIFCK